MVSLLTVAAAARRLLACNVCPWLIFLIHNECNLQHSSARCLAWGWKTLSSTRSLMRPDLPGTRVACLRTPRHALTRVCSVLAKVMRCSPGLVSVQCIGIRFSPESIGRIAKVRPSRVVVVVGDSGAQCLPACFRPHSAAPNCATWTCNSARWETEGS